MTSLFSLIKGTTSAGTNQSVCPEDTALMDHIDQVWDGRIMNSSNLASMGVYVYQVEFKNPSGKYFQKKGQITLIR